MIGIFYGSTTGNTEAAANDIAAALGVDAANVHNVGETSADTVAQYDTLLLGSSTWGSGDLQDDWYDFLDALKAQDLAGKKIALFGSWGWGGGAWMNDWEARCNDAGVLMQHAPVICQEAPDDAALAECRELGASLV